MSALTIAQVRGGRPGELATAARGLGEAGDVADREARDLARSLELALTDAQGTWADAATERAAEESKTGARLADALDVARAALDRGASDIGHTCRRLLDVIAGAEGEGFTVGDDGSVRAPTMPPVMSSPEQAAAAAAERDEAQREAAEVVVALARTTAVAQDYWYAHLVDDVALLEEVSHDGLHRFALARADQLAALAVAAAVHPDAGDGASAILAVEAAPDDPTPPDEVLEQLGAAFLRTDLVVRRPGDDEPPVLALFTGPGGCWLVDPRQAPTRAEPVTGARARGAVEESVAVVRAELAVLRG